MTNGVSKGPLYGALDRFAQFFIKPLFLESTLDRELRAVDSENKKNLQSDVWRLSQLQKSLSNPKHPYHHFSTGNLQTLRDGPEKRGVKIRDAFIEFYEKHYSANRMKLVVLGREPLDTLQSWVVELFSEVKNQNLPQNRWDDLQPLSKEELLTEVFVKPVMESRSLEISFPFQDEEDLYETQPSRYISHLIGHEGPGSVLAYLKDQGLANDLSSGAHTICPGSAFFEIRIGLTPEGLKKYREVTKTVFQYIGMMKENPPVEWMFQEQKNMGEVDFKFKQKSPASRFTSGTSSTMQQPLPREWLLSSYSKLRTFDPKAIVNAMQFLREDNFRLMIVSQDYPGDWNEREKWYGTEYKVEKIPTDIQSEIRKALHSSAAQRPADLHLPHKNEFIPTRLDVEKIDVKETSKTPKLIRNDDTIRLWWKKDDAFWVPKANLNILFRNPLTYSTPTNYVKTVTFINLVKDALTTYSYDADISGLSYTIGANMLGIDLEVHGYNDKMPVLLEKILTTLRDVEIREDRFDIIKERMMRKWKNWGFQQPYYQIGDFTRMLVNSKAWYTPLYAKELPHITVEDVRAFAPQLLAQMHTEVLAHGNLYKEDVKRIGHLIESTLKPRPLPPSQWELRRNVIIPSGSNFVFNHTLDDPENINHAIEYYLHLGNLLDPEIRSRAQLLGQMTDEPAFDQLRTKEQLGYVVWSGARTAATTIGYRVLIQSEREPKYLETRIDSFLLKFKTALDEMSSEEFEGNKRSLINKRLEKLKNLESESTRLWGYLNGEYYNFYQVDEDVAAIRKLTKKDMQKFFAEYIDPKSSSRAKLSVHLTAKKTAPESNDSIDEQRSSLTDLLSQYVESLGATMDGDAFKKSFASVKPYDKDAVVKAVRSYLSSVSVPEVKVSEIGAEIQSQLSDILVALKIRSPSEANGTGQDGETLLAETTPAPQPIEDVHRWKAGLQVSPGPVPVMDITELEEIESKL